jgi:hypothetical protein
MDSTASTSRANGPPQEVLDEILKFFSWNPPLLEIDPCKISKNGKIPKTGTRDFQAGFYDKHLGGEVVLKRVERLPALPAQLAQNVDKSLNSATKLSNLLGFITEEQREKDEEDEHVSMMDEREVANFYGKTTAKYCARVASTLALHPTNWRGNLLYWTQSGPNPDYAISDGYLFFKNKGDGPGKEEREANIETMDPEIRQIYEEMGMSRSPLATWEIKSLTSGTHGVMNAIRNLGEFSWAFCDYPDCLKNNQHDAVKKITAKVIPGPDALSPPWKLPVSLHSLNRNFFKFFAHYTLGKFFRYK